jgi:flagellar biosynthesis protein FliR
VNTLPAISPITDGLHLDQVLAAAVFVGARISGLMVFSPFLGNSAIPAPLKATLTVLLTALVYPLHAPLQLAFDLWSWGGVALSELVIGLALGLAANFMMEAPILAGQILGVQMGYSLATVFDPQTQADTPVLGTLHNLTALLIFLQLDIHHWMLRAIVRSFAYMPAGSAFSSLAGVTALLHAAGGIFLAAVQIAAPALAATLVTDVVLGFLGKASPQLPVLFVGLAAKNLLGLMVMLMAIGYWPRFFSDHFTQSIVLVERLLHLAH